MRNLSTLILMTFAFTSFLGSCSVWDQLGQDPSNEMLSSYSNSPHFNWEEKAFENRIPDILEKMNERIDWRLTLEYFTNDSSRRTPDKPLPEVNPPDLRAFLEPTDSLRFIWLGHSTLLVNAQNKLILFDPVFSNSAAPVNFLVQRFQPATLSLEELPPIDYIVISHDHYDHLDMRSVQFFRDKEATFLVPLGIKSHLEYWGVASKNIVELDWWADHEFEGIRFVCTPAQHFSGRTGTNQTTLWASWIVDSPNSKIYFSGDSGYDEHYQKIGDQLGPFDAAFIDSGQYNERWREVHNLPEEAVQAAIDLRAKQMIPIHWAMFELSLHDWDEPIKRSQQAAEELGMELMTPKLGQVVDLSLKNQFSHWWEQVQ